MNENEHSNIYHIPANYTDAGKWFGGMLEIRNTIEAVILVGLLGYPMLIWLPLNATTRFVLMVITLLPIGVAALMGISGDSLGQYLYHMFIYWGRRQKMQMRRVGHRYVSNKTKKR